MILIGIAGRAGAGKSTLAKMMLEEFDKQSKPTRIIPFAKALKDLATSIGWNGKKDEKGRRLLQLLGTELCRECINTDYWIEKWYREIENFKSENLVIDDFDNAIIIADDVRYQNEVRTIRSEKNHLLIKLVDREDTNVKSSHASEQGLDDMNFNIIFSNSGSLWALECEAKILVEGILARMKSND